MPRLLRSPLRPPCLTHGAANNPDSPHAERRVIVFGFPNSYGTLGYALRIKARAAPVLPYVHLDHVPYHGVSAFLAAIERSCSENEFMTLYGGAAYRALKAKCDPQSVFPDLYEKCVLRR